MSQKAILVVDDQEIVLDYVAHILTGAGYRVLTACGPELALYVAEHCKSDIQLLVTDFEMPGSSGVELAHRLISTRPSLGVIMISGRDRDEVPLHPTWAFIPKPFMPAALLDLVAEMSPSARMPIGREARNGNGGSRKAG